MKINKHKLFQRILVTIPVFIIIFISYTAYAIKRSYLFLLYGGEVIAFEKPERATIQDIYDELKAQRQ